MAQVSKGRRAWANRLLLFAGSLIVAAAWLWAWLGPADAADRQPFSGPVESVADIPPDVQDVLQQAPAPTHTEPTPWGLFVINPVIDGHGILNPQEPPIPVFGSNVERTESSGDGAIEELLARGFVVPDIPAAASEGLELAAAVAFREGELYSTWLFFGADADTSNSRSLIVHTYTPTQPVVFDEFPDNAIRDFRANTVVNGQPTLSVFPDQGTSDPRGERIVAWSREGAVFQITTTGLFGDGDVVDLARHIDNVATEGVSRQ